MREHRSELHLTEDDTAVKVEPHLMQQVVFNLVNNACQAMRDTGTITIETEMTADRSQIVLHIKDSGPGIAPEIMENIFEPFFTTKEKGEGTGLGLSMCQQVIQKFGGRIGVQSEVGNGAHFSVHLPSLSGSEK